MQIKKEYVLIFAVIFSISAFVTSYYGVEEQTQQKEFVGWPEINGYAENTSDIIEEMDEHFVNDTWLAQPTRARCEAYFAPFGSHKDNITYDCLLQHRMNYAGERAFDMVRIMCYMNATHIRTLMENNYTQSKALLRDRCKQYGRYTLEKQNNASLPIQRPAPSLPTAPA